MSRDSRDLPEQDTALSNRLCDLEGDLGSAFRSAMHDSPHPGAKAALLVAMSASVGLATTTATTTAAAAATATSATAATTKVAAAGVAAKTSIAMLATKVIVASAIVVGGTTAATTYALRDSDDAAVKPTAPAITASVARHTAPPAPPPPRAPLPAPVVEEAPTTITTIEVQALPPAPATAPPPSPTPTPTTSPSSRVVVEPAAPAAAAPSPPLPPSTTINDEIAELDRARAELAAGRGAAALATIDRYRGRFPRGVMQEEARVLEIEALARAGQPTRARELGAAFLAERPASPLATRVRRVLVAE